MYRRIWIGHLRNDGEKFALLLDEAAQYVKLEHNVRKSKADIVRLRCVEVPLGWFTAMLLCATNSELPMIPPTAGVSNGKIDEIASKHWVGGLDYTELYDSSGNWLAFYKNAAQQFLDVLSKHRK